MITRRNFLSMSAKSLTLLPFLLATSANAESLSKLVLAGPPAPLSLPLARLAKRTDLSKSLPSMEMKQWRNPDIMRAWMISDEVQVSAAPSNAAAILYNKGLPVRLLDVNNGGILSILTSNPAIKKFTDIKGKKIVLFFRGDTPDMIVRYLATKQGINPDTDMSPSYVDSPFEALQMLLSARADTVLLPEPAATAAIMKAKSKGIELTRIVLQDVWEQVTGSKLPLPLGGTICQGALAQEHPKIIKELQIGIRQSVEWINQHPAEAAQEFAGFFGLKAQVLQKSLETFPISQLPAKAAQKDLEFYYTTLMGMSPKLIGGKLPDKAFYLG
ncbi:ABC transporter substrate-binding protein [Desulfovibrio gilichinskyi]|uniref:NitT/TauT family transport system substrate-binding protein n=1 Tax=Desulfovibrio gilichinskyi TaxID=1519643 RepID=A0A1X7CSK8_9BACT|nr:MqnA/MqnD/SBP family protein [Desulfovibrio gilichinskyi]SMF02367.1 NitT/TauT family transport system substrate-binding protein [Desulfovibrio gilichinskyi]